MKFLGRCVTVSATCSLLYLNNPDTVWWQSENCRIMITVLGLVMMGVGIADMMRNVRIASIM